MDKPWGDKEGIYCRHAAQSELVFLLRLLEGVRMNFHDHTTRPHAAFSPYRTPACLLALAWCWPRLGVCTGFRYAVKTMLL
jgi:hypothetical protein